MAFDNLATNPQNSNLPIQSEPIVPRQISPYMSLADHQSKNVPIRFGRILPQDELVCISILSKISKKKIEELAIH